ncbi:MAG: hypothetical protein MUE70_01420 [Desulfobacterales bacterium]|nr:hypothetical protein [Desulfobacterales bacterium]
MQSCIVLKRLHIVLDIIEMLLLQGFQLMIHNAKGASELRFMKGGLHMAMT